MSIQGLSSKTALQTASLSRLRNQLEDLQRQLGTGKKTETLGGLGAQSGLSVAFRSRLSATGAYQDTIKTVGVRMEVMQTALTRIVAIGGEVKTSTRPGTVDFLSGGQTAAQKSTRDRFSEVMGLLNERVGDRYVFAGKAGTTPATEAPDKVLDGDGARAGLKQVIAERRLADLGATGSGRVAVGGAGTAATITEDAAGHPFGFKIAAISTTIVGATATGPTGAPASAGIDLVGGNAAADDRVRVTLNLPDGSQETIELVATAGAPLQAGEFQIGATPADTATNIRAALDAAVLKTAKTSLVAASAVAAGTNFFAIDAANPPQRVAGPPFDTATALVAGTPANTVTWYVGEAGSDPARQTMTAQIDRSVTIQYGARGNEEAIRWQAQHVAVFAAIGFNAADPDARAAYQELSERVSLALSVPAGVARIEGVQAEIGGAQSAMKAASDQHKVRHGMLEGLVAGIEDSDTQEVGAQLLVMQTRLEASLQTTALLSRISLVNYL